MKKRPRATNRARTLTTNTPGRIGVEYLAMHPYDRRIEPPRREFISLDEFATRIGRTRRTIDRHRKLGTLSIPVYDVLGRPMIREADYEPWIAGQLMEGGRPIL